MEKRTVELGGPWQFKEFPESARRMRDLEQGHWMPTQAPSSIYTSLIEAGCITRFDLEANPEDFEWVSEREWVFRHTFEANEEVCDTDCIELVFEGLDTVAQIWLNEKLLGKTENMFIPYRFDVTDRIQPGLNTLMVKFLSPTAYAERLLQRYGKLSDHHYGDPRRSYIRKAQYQFGSVLGPALPGCGIYRPVRLEAFKTARIDEVHIRTIDCNQQYADVKAAIRIRRAAGQETTPLAVQLRIGGGGLDLHQTLRFEPGECQNTTIIRIERPFFWHPTGLGVQHLYRLTTRLDGPDGRRLDERQSHFGVRTIRLIRGKDARGSAFRFEVNDTPVHIKGANWMPLSMFPGTHTEADYERLLTTLKAAHVNMLRVWGGGYYEDEAFYRLCDRLGILVWQDFAFASAYYPDRQWFLDIVEAEAQAVVRRLRNYACLAIWCGNSRIDHLHETGRLGEGRKFYGRGIYHELLPGLLSELDPDREYLPTTPYSDLNTKDLNAASEGTSHFWEVWNSFAPSTEYLFALPEMPRFLSEFGLQSLPNRTCLSRVCPPHRLYRSSPAIEKHAYQADGDVRIARYTAELFRPPRNLDEQIAQSQLVQARAIKRCAEHLRANAQINGGLLLWTANDCAAGAGFSAIDYSGQPKALYYYMRRFFAPILITLECDKDACLGSSLKGKGVVVVNDTAAPLTGHVRCRCMDFYGRTLDEIEFPAAVGPFARSAPTALPRALAYPKAPNRCVLELELITDAKVIAENRFYYLPDKYIDWPAATLDVEITAPDPTSWSLSIASQTMVRDLYLCPPDTGVPSDNFIAIPPHRPQHLTIRFDGQAPSTRIPLALRSIPCGLG